jgi:hypothetical protein
LSGAVRNFSIVSELFDEGKKEEPNRMMIPKKSCSGRNVPSCLGRRCGELLFMEMIEGVGEVHPAGKENVKSVKLINLYSKVHVYWDFVSSKKKEPLFC